MCNEAVNCATAGRDKESSREEEERRGLCFNFRPAGAYGADKANALRPAAENKLNLL